MANKVKILCGLCLCALAVNGQSIKKAFEVQLPEPLSHAEMEWISLDSDTLMDVVVAGIASSGELKIMTFRNNLTSLQFSKSQDTGFKDGTIQLTDWNGDSKMDLLIAGKTTVDTHALFVFQNNGDFSFQKASKLIDEGSPFRIADFNNDGMSDILTLGTGNGPLKIYGNSGSGFSVVYDSAGITAMDAVIFDFNKDGLDDVVVSGQSGAEPFTTLLAAKNKFRFRATALQNPVNGSLSAIDLNADGKVDLIAAGKSSGSTRQQVWLSDSLQLNPGSSFPAPETAALFTGDMNLDGIADAVVNGLDENGISVSYIRESDVVTLSLDAAGLIVQKPGDFDRDGDLDIAQLKDSVNQQWIKIKRADNPVSNKRPPIPLSHFAISTYNKTFIYWKGGSDDHTATSSLTYDVWLGNDQGTIISSGFGRIPGPRQTVTHGNAGTKSSKIIMGLNDGHYQYMIQAVDNAYNGSREFTSVGGGGSGAGSGGAVFPCFDISHVSINACKDQEVTLKSSDQTVWFSAAFGFLANGPEYKFMATQTDTLFSFVPQQNDCSKNKAWITTVLAPSQLTQKETLYVCEGKEFKLGIAPGWKNIEWGTNPPLTGVDTIRLTLTNDQVISVTATSDVTSCPYKKEFTIKISKPVLTVKVKTFKAMKGNPVQLEAEGEFKHFLWVPSAGLSDPTISNPVAKPLQSTIYTVTATDSVGCVATDKIQVQIESSAFVPNLFTPNGDGKNDVLLIYGLSSADTFQFQIFNREGSLVYETTDVAEASTSGWNGTVRGTQQPNGVYYWKIDGTVYGEPLLLNGKKTGSILLVH